MYTHGVLAEYFFHFLVSLAQYATEKYEWLHRSMYTPARRR